MGPKGLLFCLVLSLVLVSIYSIDIFENMKDLKEKTYFGKYFPRQGLLLLCWLFSQGKIDQNGKLRLNFNPAKNPFGFHQYNNYDLTFPDVSNTNFQYFSLGNLFKQKAKHLPGYIIGKICKSNKHPQVNIDRVIIRIDSQNPMVVDEVYITQHHGDKSKGSDYVKELTHKIGQELLKEIEELCRPDRDDSDPKRDKEDPDNQRLQKIRTMYPDNAHLHQFLYSAGYDAGNDISEHSNCNSQAQSTHSKSDTINLQLISTPDRRVSIVWDGIPDEMLKMEVKIGVYMAEDEDEPLLVYPLDGRPNGEIHTPLALNRGFQLRLIKPITTFETVHKSPESEDSEIEMDDTVPDKRVEATPSFTFSKLVSLVLSPFSSLFSLVYFIVSSLFSLVYFIVSTLLLTVYVTVSSVFSRLLFIFQQIAFMIGKLISLIFSFFFQLVLTVLSIILIEVIRRAIVDMNNDRSRAAPHFVTVSHGRPGF